MNTALPIPATLHTTSTRPNTSSARANMASTSASWVTSTWQGTTASPAWSAVSCSAPLMSAARTWAPSSTNNSVEAFAIPEPAPVMTATLPSSKPMTISLCRPPEVIPPPRKLGIKMCGIGRQRFPICLAGT